MTKIDSLIVVSLTWILIAIPFIIYRKEVKKFGWEVIDKTITPPLKILPGWLTVSLLFLLIFGLPNFLSQTTAFNDFISADGFFAETFQILVFLFLLFGIFIISAIGWWQINKLFILLLPKELDFLKWIIGIITAGFILDYWLSF